MRAGGGAARAAEVEVAEKVDAKLQDQAEGDRADLSAASRAVIVRDIEERLVISGGQLGMPMDTALWLRLRDALRDA